MDDLLVFTTIPMLWSFRNLSTNSISNTLLSLFLINITKHHVLLTFPYHKTKVFRTFPYYTILHNTFFILFIFKNGFCCLWIRKRILLSSTLLFSKCYILRTICLLSSDDWCVFLFLGGIISQCIKENHFSIFQLGWLKYSQPRTVGTHEKRRILSISLYSSELFYIISFFLTIFKIFNRGERCNYPTHSLN